MFVILRTALQKELVIAEFILYGRDHLQGKPWRKLSAEKWRPWWLDDVATGQPSLAPSPPHFLITICPVTSSVMPSSPQTS